MAIINSGIYQNFLCSYLKPFEPEVFFVGNSGMIGYVSKGTIEYVSPAGYSSYNFQDFDFDSTRQYGYAVTEDGLVFESIDYGRTWQSATTLTISDTRVLKVSPNNWVWVGGANSSNVIESFLKSGSTYQQSTLSLSSTGPVEDYAFAPDNERVVIQHNFFQWDSTNSGATFNRTDSVTIGSKDGIIWSGSTLWQLRENTTFQLGAISTGFTSIGGLTIPGGKRGKAFWLGDNYMHMSFEDGLVARVSGFTNIDQTTLLTTTDDCEEIEFNGATGYVCVGTSIYKTINEGASWDLLTSAATAYIRAIKII